MGRSRYGPLSNQRCNLVSPLAAEWRTVGGWHRRPQIGQKTALDGLGETGDGEPLATACVLKAECRLVKTVPATSRSQAWNVS
jgi:hypothetical protein